MSHEVATATTAPDVEAFRLLQSGRAAEALPLARRAVANSRSCSPAHGLLASVLLRLGDREEATSVVAAALASPPGTADAYDALAFVSLHLGQHERANALYRRAAEQAPHDARFWYNLASSERSLGRLIEAESACDRAIALDPRHYQTYLLRAELRIQTSSRNHVEAMERLLADPAATDRARMFLGYALAKELDDLECYDAAFHWYSQGAAARRRHLVYDVRHDEMKLARIGQVFSTADPLVPSCPVDSARFIFIVGLPRTGTTLVEQMLIRLPGVVSNGETENFARALLDETPAAGSDLFARAAAAPFDRVGLRYASLADRPDCAKVIEKLPLNYLYLGAIRRALPAAIPVLLARDPIDSCFAMFRTLFGQAYPFSYEFAELARYYSAYSRLLDHWRQLLGSWTVDVHYENLVRHPAEMGRDIATACGVPWDSSAVEIHTGTGVSMTASASQIRRPIYQSSAGKWRRYRRHLTPLVEALRSHGVAVPNADD